MANHRIACSCRVGFEKCLIPWKELKLNLIPKMIDKSTRSRVSRLINMNPVVPLYSIFYSDNSVLN